MSEEKCDIPVDWRTGPWSWEEAFAKFGFADGEGSVETWKVEAVLVRSGYTVKTNQWGSHNTVISSIKKHGEELMPFEAYSEFEFGFDNPRDYLPKKIVRLLDENLPSGGPAVDCLVSFSGARGKALLGEEKWEDRKYAQARRDRNAAESGIFILKDKVRFGQVSRNGIAAVRAEQLEKVLTANALKIVELRRRKYEEEQRASWSSGLPDKGKRDVA